MTEAPQPLQLDAVIQTFVKLRDKKAVITAAHKAECEALDLKLDKIGAYIKEQADAQGVTSFKTVHGTAYLSTTAFAQVADWDATLNFITANGAYDMLERRVSKKAVQAWVETHRQVPPGINYGTRIDVGVRRPSNKGGLDEGSD